MQLRTHSTSLCLFHYTAVSKAQLYPVHLSEYHWIYLSYIRKYMSLICCVLLLVILSIWSNSITVQVCCIMGGELILSKLYSFCFQFIMLPNTIFMSHYGIAFLRNDLAEWRCIMKRQAFWDDLKEKQLCYAWWHEGCWVELNCCPKQLPVTTVVELTNSYFKCPKPNWYSLFTMTPKFSSIFSLNTWEF